MSIKGTNTEQNLLKAFAVPMTAGAPLTATPSPLATASIRFRFVVLLSVSRVG